MTGLDSNLASAFWGWNATYHAAAGLGTVALVETDADADVQRFFQDEDPLGQGFGDFVLVTGYFVPTLFSGSLWLGGVADRDTEVTGAGAAGLQAVGLTAGVVGIEKLISGRRGPTQPDCQAFCRDPSKRTSDPGDFRFDFWARNPASSGRTFWPSGHTATAVALVSSMHAYYPDQAWIPWVGYPLATAVGVGMIDGDYHWASDVFAGALTGGVIGWTVGRRFRKLVDTGRSGGAEPQDGTGSTWILAPALSRHGGVLVASGSW